MNLANDVTEILELSKNLFPYRENLRGELGEQVLLSLKPAENFDHLKNREALLREWLDLTDHQGEFKFSAGLESVSGMFTQALLPFASSRNSTCCSRGGRRTAASPRPLA